MSLDILKNAFHHLDTCDGWSLQLLNIKTSKRHGTTYNSRQITLSPSELIDVLLKDIANIYIGNGKKSLDSYKAVREYDGTTDALTVYKLNVTNELIATEYAALLPKIADPNTETDPFEYTSAYLLKGQIQIEDETIPVKLVSMQNPVTTLKRKYRFDNGLFKSCSEKLLSLRPTIDIFVYDNTVYFLTLAGENLFNMARSYKAVCHKNVEIVEDAQIMQGIDVFKEIAESGHNPRKFISFNPEGLAALKQKSVRRTMALKFSIPMDSGRDKFDATVDGASEKIVKLLCSKGMLEPFKGTAVEVESAWKWI